MLVMRSGYDLERAKLEASKQEILSEIEGLKNRITVKVSEGDLKKAQTTARATDISQGIRYRPARGEEEQGHARPGAHQRPISATWSCGRRLMASSRFVPNPRAQGFIPTEPARLSRRETQFVAGAEIVDIPDLSSMVVEFRVEEIDRGTDPDGTESSCPR